MQSNIQKFKEELDQLIAEGELLRVGLVIDVYDLDDEQCKELKKLKPPRFKDKYERWYSISMQVIKQVLPDRFTDFTKLYRDEKRKDIDFLTYGVADYMIGLRSSRGIETIADGKAAYPKFEQQLNILKSAKDRLESALFDMVEVLQADLFDNELDSAGELLKKGFVRAAGAISGVVLEKHLDHVCHRHNLKTRKKHPTINDFNQLLKDGNVIDTAVWRQIQHIGDIRNLCDHNKGRDPTKEECLDLISGVERLIKTLF